MIRILIDGIEPINQPKGVDELGEGYLWSVDFRLLARELQGDVVFFGQDFTNLYTLFKTDPCALFQIEVQQTAQTEGDWFTIYFGTLFLNEVDFLLDEHFAKVTLTDNGFVSNIQRNADIKLDMNIATTKDGSVNPAKIFDNLGIRSMNDATVISYDTISIYNALDFAVRFCSNNQLSFYSAYLLSNPDNLNDLYLMSGVGLRTNAGADSGTIAPNNITTRELFRDMTRLLGLYGVVELMPDGSQRMRYEDYSYWNALLSGNTLNEFSQAVVSVRDAAYFQSIRFGSAVSKFSAYMTGWLNQETYAGSSDCNKENTVDLTLQRCITDSVVIDEIFLGDDTYDENTIVIHDQSLMFVIGLGYDPSDTSNSPGYYNWMIRNIDLLNRSGVEYCLGEPNFKPLCSGYFENSTDQSYTRVLLIDFWGPDWDIVDEGNCMDYQYIGAHYPRTYVPNQVIYDVTTNPTGDLVDTLFQIDYRFILDIPNQVVRFYLVFGDLFTVVNPDDSIVADDPLGNWTSATPIIAKPGYAVYLEINNPATGPIYGNILEGTIDVFLSGNHGFNDSLLNYVSPLFLVGGSGGDTITVKAGSFLRITNLVKEEINFPVCQSQKYQVQASGFIDSDTAKNIRSNPLAYQTITHRDGSLTGQIETLTRNLLSGKSEILLNTKQI